MKFARWTFPALLMILLGTAACSPGPAGATPSAAALLPEAAASSTSLPTPFPTPSMPEQVFFEADPSYFRFEFGMLVIPGIVQNTADVEVSDIQIELTGFDQQGNQILSARFPAAIDRAIPGAAIPFQFERDFTQIDGMLATYFARAVASTDPTTHAAFLMDVQVAEDLDGFTISGAFSNAAGGACAQPRVVLAGFSDNGPVYRVASTPLTNADGEPVAEVKVGEKVPFLVPLAREGMARVEAYPACAP